MSLDAQTLRRVMSGVDGRRAEEDAPLLTTAMREDCLATVARPPAFPAQFAHESGGPRHFEERADGSADERRRDLGDDRPGDGRFYEDRGPIQLTGRANHRAYGALPGLPLERLGLRRTIVRLRCIVARSA
jgi:putative chitinase